MKQNHEALGDLVLYCQKRARNIPMNTEPFALSDVDIQRDQETLVAYGFRIHDYAQWTHKWEAKQLNKKQSIMEYYHK